MTQFFTLSYAASTLEIYLEPEKGAPWPGGAPEKVKQKLCQLYLLCVCESYCPPNHLKIKVTTNYISYRR